MLFLADVSIFAALPLTPQELFFWH